MQALTHPAVLKRAALAALLSVLACYPRLYMWDERGLPLSFTLFTLAWCMFVLWGFVLAWHFRYSGHFVFKQPFRPGLWAAATACGFMWAFAVFYAVDPQQRVLTPADYPADWPSWIAKTFFSLSLEPLFLCFAPFAFFIRLTNRQTTAIALTVIFGLFVLYLKLNTSKALPSFPIIAELVLLRVITGFLWVFFYLKGGVFLVWWLGILLQLRLPFEFNPPL